MSMPRTLKRLDDLDALRLSFIGVPRYWRSTTLPANHVWANGDLALFSDWPELKKVYDGGGFTGMLLAYNANAATIAANLGKWRPNSATPTGLFTPKLGDQFFRAWTGTGEAGAWKRDEMRNITGTLGEIVLSNQFSGAFYLSVPSNENRILPQGSYAAGRAAMDISRVVPTGPQNVPQHVLQPVLIYLGNHV